MLGTVLAHEIGHYLGLFHPIDNDGTRDIIDDTPFYTVLPNNLMNMGTELTAGQKLVIHAHPHLRHDPLGLARPLRIAPPMEVRIPEGACGTCGR